MKEKKVFSKKIQFFLIVAILFTLSASIYVSISKKNTVRNLQKEIVCTMEAKICPDGSFVGRTGPNCDFSPCPKENQKYTWRKMQNDALGIAYEYPEKLSTAYMHPVTWPPKVSVVKGVAEKGAVVFADFSEVQVKVGVHPNEVFNCVESKNTNPGIPSVSKRMVDNRMYCVRSSSEGAAGSVYEADVYELYKEGRLITAEVIMQKPNCDNYDDPKKSECFGERETFDLDSIVDKILQSVLFAN
jgi:uncharacterized protein (UPF0179 family)